MEDVNKRANRLMEEFKLPVGAIVTNRAYNEKKSVAVGAANSYNALALSESEKIKSTAGLEFDFPNENDAIQSAKWTSRVPFKFSLNNKLSKYHIHAKSCSIGQNYSIPPEFPFWEGKVTGTIFENFNAKIKAAGDTRVYDGDGTNILLQVSPFGILCETILNSFRDKKNW